MITQKEQEILEALVSSVPRKAIGSLVGLSVKTVNRRIREMCRRFKCNGTQQLIYYVGSNDLLTQKGQKKDVA